MGEDPDFIATKPPVRNSPRFAEFAVEDGENCTYFLFVEQKTICETHSFQKSFLLVLCALYFSFKLL